MSTKTQVATCNCTLINSKTEKAEINGTERNVQKSAQSAVGKTSLSEHELQHH